MLLSHDGTSWQRQDGIGRRGIDVAGHFGNRDRHPRHGSKSTHQELLLADRNCDTKLHSAAIWKLELSVTLAKRLSSLVRLLLGHEPHPRPPRMQDSVFAGLDEGARGAALHVGPDEVRMHWDW